MIRLRRSQRRHDSWTLPERLVRAAHLASVSLTGAVRNLALWTRYTGVDPEVTNTLSQNVVPNQATASNVVNNDVRFDEGTVPLARYWVLRLTAGF
jgi:hypothetical protein